MFLIAAALPMLIGFVRYGNMEFGKKWRPLNGFVEEDLQGGNTALSLG